MLANHVGIIDSGYRGNIKAAFRSFEDTVILKETRILQICHASLKPFYVRLYNNEEVLNTTSRGYGGFGSTGI
jgi:dUTPase